VLSQTLRRCVRRSAHARTASLLQATPLACATRRLPPPAALHRAPPPPHRAAAAAAALPAAKPRSVSYLRLHSASRFARRADTGFDAFWASINKELNFLHLEMRRVSHVSAAGAPPVRYVGIVNKLGDEHAKLATRFMPSQLALFRAIVRTRARRASRCLLCVALFRLGMGPLRAAL
jgi:hypothetical protein